MDAARIEARFWPKVEKRGPDECWLWKAGTDGRGYGKISAGGGVRLMHRAHRVAYELFIGPIPQGRAVCHTCDNPGCVNPAHLRLGTQAENLAEMRERGRQGGEGLPFGSQHGMAKLDAEKVREIRRLYAAGGWTQRALGRRFGVAKSQIGSVLNGRTWSHVEQEA